MSISQRELPQEAIASRAYELWEARGCPPGDGTEDWERAVAELTSGRRNGSPVEGLLDWLSRIRKNITGRDM
jgi:hypothetical protein